MSETGVTQKKKRGITRRSFLKTTAAVGGVAALSGTAFGCSSLGAAGNQTGTNKDTIVAGACRGNCFNGCFLNIHVRDDKVVMTSAGEFPDPEYNRICLKGLSHTQRIYDPRRIKYPMRRVGERGSGEWERISWDEAIKSISDQWKAITQEYGLGAIGMMNVSGQYGSVNGMGAGAAFYRFNRFSGATYVSSSTDVAFGFGNSRSIGGGFSGAPKEYQNSRYIIAWGGNHTESHMQQWHFVADAVENGAKLVVIDPTYTTCASKADLFVPIRPGSDGALALAMVNVVIEEGLADEAFLKNSTVAPFLVKKTDGKFLRENDISGTPKAEDAPDIYLVVDAQSGAYVPATSTEQPKLHGTFNFNGVEVTTAYDLLLKHIAQYTPEEAEKLCDVPVDTIREIAISYATNKPASIFEGLGLDHYTNGHHTMDCVATLAIVTGNLAKPGAMIGAGGGTPGGSYLNPDISKSSGVEVAPDVSILKMPEIVNTGMFGTIPHPIKGLFLAGSNPLGNAADRKLMIEEVFKKLDLLVVVDISTTDTTEYADYLLPAAHWFEENDLQITYGRAPYAIIQEKAIEPSFESKSDFDIYKLLSTALGCGEAFDMTEEGYIDLLLDTDAAREIGLTLESLKKEKTISVLSDKTTLSGADGVFLTPTGRTEFYREAPTANFKFGQTVDFSSECMPTFVPPTEAWPENPLAQKYPLVFFAEHSRWRTHSQWSHTPWLKELNPEPIVKINSNEAQKRGISSGDLARVFNDRGEVVIKVVINSGVKDGTLNIPKGWHFDQFISGHYNELTSTATNETCVNTAFFDALVQIEKY